MLNKISSILDAVADSLEKKGLIKEALEIDKIANAVDSTKLLAAIQRKADGLEKNQDKFVPPLGPHTKRLVDLVRKNKTAEELKEALCDGHHGFSLIQYAFEEDQRRLKALKDEVRKNSSSWHVFLPSITEATYFISWAEEFMRANRTESKEESGYWS